MYLFTPLPVVYRRLCVAGLLLFLTWPLAAQTNRRIQQLQKESTALKKQITESEQLLKSTKKDVHSQLNNLAVINSRIVEQQRLVDGFQTEVNTLSADIHVLQSQLDTLQADLAACKRKYHRTVVYMNRNRLLQNRLSFIFTAPNFRQMYRRMRYAADYTKYLRAQGDIIRHKEEAVRAKQDALHAAKRDKDALLTDARSQHAELENQKTQRQTVINDLNKKQKQLQSTLTQKRSQQTKLNARIEQLIKQEIAAAEARRKKAEAERRRKAEAEARRKREQEAREKAEAERRAKAEAAAKSKAAAAKASTTTTAAGKTKTAAGKTTATTKSTPKTESRTSTPVYSAEDPTDRTLSSGFRANRGRLPVPITGTYAVTSRYGQYSVEGLSGVTLDNKGINLTGQRGAQARCVYNGEVTTVANIGGSYTVIVRHGGYFSVYCNLSHVSVRSGQNVTTRQTLGTVATDASGNATLHFQLRNGASAAHIDPLPWLAR
jgi:septal ring factor EnvC (AmiA/AmiB activator)